MPIGISASQSAVGDGCTSMTLVEEHERGCCLFRVRARLRPSFAGTVQGLTLAVLLAGATGVSMALYRPSASVVASIAGDRRDRTARNVAGDARGRRPRPGRGARDDGRGHVAAAGAPGVGAAVDPTPPKPRCPEGKRVAGFLDPLVPPTVSHARRWRSRSCRSRRSALAALAPWPLKIVVDNVLGDYPLPGPFAALVASAGGASPVALLVIIVVAGLLLQIASEADAHDPDPAAGRDGPAPRLRPAGAAARPPAGPPAAAPHADQDGRLGLPARCRRALRRRPRHRRRLPAGRCVLNLGVMFVILVVPRPPLGLLSLAVVPSLYLCLRYYSAHDDRPGRAGEGAGIHADRSGVRDSVLGRRGQELRPRAARAGAVLAIRRTRPCARGSASRGRSRCSRSR